MHQTFHIRLSTELTNEHSSAFQAYLQGAHQLSRAEWRTLRAGIRLLASCQIDFQNRTYTFEQFYRTFLEVGRASTFLAALYQLTNLQQMSASLQAQYAREILAWLTANNLYSANATDSGFLVIYCLYQWSSFANGHIFQLIVFRDLTASNIHFRPNDPRDPQQRFADHDLVVQGFRGDVKQSLYFLDALPRRSLTADFYMTQMRDRRRTSQRWVVLLHERMWKTINGSTTPGQLTDATQWFPAPVAITLQQEPWIVMAYEEWKTHILSIQERRS